jgi:putative drug exporter of the RND superfamily
VVRTVRTAGRTVLFSAAAVVAAFTALVLAPLQFLQSIGYSGIAAAAMAGMSSLIVLPAVLATLGGNVNRATVWKRSTRPANGRGFWHWSAVVVMRRPLLFAGGVIAVLVLVASPVLHFKPGLVDDRELPARTESRVTGDILRADFDTRAAAPIFVVLPGVQGDQQAGPIGIFAARVAALPDVARVVTATGSYTRSDHTAVSAEVAGEYRSAGSTYVEVVADAEPVSSKSEELIDRIRALPTPFDRVLVTGEAANAYDVKEAIVGAVPAGIAVIALATFLVLFIQFGSLLVPIKAIVLNVLSLGALFGTLVWVFQDGHLSGLLDFTAVGSTYINIPILIFCLAFGLSMDYEVFLLSRIKEEYDRTGDNEQSVALGLERSGRIVTAAAVLIALVFLTTGILGTARLMKMYGLGVAFVVLLDAFVIRGTLVPALMKLAGSANWWAPRPLRWLHDRIGISEHVELEPGGSVADATAELDLARSSPTLDPPEPTPTTPSRGFR